MKLYRILIFFLLILSINCAQAIDQRGKIWTQISTEGKITQDRKWTYFTDIEFRHNMRNFRLDTTLSEFGIGYHFSPDLSAWIGYQLQDNSTPTNKSNTNNYWQQVLWHTVVNEDQRVFTLRSRIEERVNNRADGINIRIRERMTFWFPRLAKFPILLPVIMMNYFLMPRDHHGVIKNY